MTWDVVELFHQNQSYPIHIGQQWSAHPELLRKSITGKQVLIVTQSVLAATHLPVLQDILKAYQCDVYYLPEGEEHKNITQWQHILEVLLRQGHDRTTTLIALGGGVVGDITGFAAACYLRGVNYLQIPTTLIAQVDAAIGGKTAVNHALGKNMIGAFHQPRAVLIDVDFLKTLPQRDYQAGLAEVIKYGLIRDPVFFAWIEKNISALLAREDAAVLHAVKTSVRHKAEIVSLDEKEQGMRSLLNLGHTFGHALETANGYQHILHGEAVLIGMGLAAELSHTLGWLSTEDLERIKCLLQKITPKQSAYRFPMPDDWIELMHRDKKSRDGKLNFILLKSIGHAEKMTLTDLTPLTPILPTSPLVGEVDAEGGG